MLYITYAAIVAGINLAVLLLSSQQGRDLPAFTSAIGFMVCLLVTVLELRNYWKKNP